LVIISSMLRKLSGQAAYQRARHHYFQRAVQTLNHSARRINHLRTVKLHRPTLPVAPVATELAQVAGMIVAMPHSAPKPWSALLFSIAYSLPQGPTPSAVRRHRREPLLPEVSPVRHASEHQRQQARHIRDITGSAPVTRNVVF
jgi:hypothetical protein